jgi:hypothetical protein
LSYDYSFGTHIISAATACGSASKEFTFSEEIDGVSLYINICPGTEPYGGAELSHGSVSGQWIGRLYQFGKTIHHDLIGIYTYSLNLTQTGSDVVGTARIEHDSDYAVMDLSGALSNGILSISESSIIETDSQGSFILKTATLNYIDGPTQILEGTWVSNGGPPGSIFLMKTNDFGMRHAMLH